MKQDNNQVKKFLEHWMVPIVMIITIIAAKLIVADNFKYFQKYIVPFGIAVLIIALAALLLGLINIVRLGCRIWNTEKKESRKHEGIE